jgi:hypothetical protein
MSQGMVLCATTGSHGTEGDVVLLALDHPTPPGAPVS